MVLRLPWDPGLKTLLPLAAWKTSSDSCREPQGPLAHPRRVPLTCRIAIYISVGWSRQVEGWPPGFLAYKQGRESLGASFFSHEECDRFQAKTPPAPPFMRCFLQLFVEWWWFWGGWRTVSFLSSPAAPPSPFPLSAPSNYNLRFL